MRSNPALATDSVRLETKAAAPAPAADPTRRIVDTLDAQGRTIDAMRTTITTLEAKASLAERKSRALKALRDEADADERDTRRGRTDPLRRETQRKANADIDSIERRELEELRAMRRTMERKAARPAGPAGQRTAGGLAGRAQAKHLLAAAQNHYLRTGETSFKGRHIREFENAVYGPEAKAMHSGSNADGGFLVTAEEDRAIERLLAEIVPMRQHATVTNITSAEYKKYVRTSTGGARWGNELNSGGETATPKYALLNYPAHNLYGEPLVSRDLVEDSGFDIVGEINDGVLEDFELSENVAFISGDGVEKPFGILGYSSDTYVANTSWAFGKIGYTVTGASGAFPASSGGVGSADPILKMPLSLKAAYRQQAKFMGNRTTIGLVRTLKDGAGSYVWIQADLTRGIPATLCGHEFIEAEQMPDVGANSFSLALADWGRAYRIVDRSGMSVLRDEYTRYPSIAFKCAKRVGGGVMNFDAIKLLKFGTA